ncbi:MAG TPA: trigger factor [Bacilli bacterium]|nr:trigger factor [Bacilli bacterium]
MNFTVEKLEGNKVKITVTVDKSQFEVALDEAFVKVSQDVKVDGFRKGKLPKSIYLKKFGIESLYEEAINIALSTTYPTVLAESNLAVIAQPEIDLDFTTVGQGKDLVYTATVEVEPTVTLGEYFGTKVSPLSTEVTDADIQARIDTMLKTKAENVIKETAVEHGDTAVIDFEGFLDGVAFEGGKGENHPLEIGSNSFIPGFEEQLIGMNLNEEKEIKVTFPEQYQAEQLAGKETTFKVKVNEIKTKVLPELTAEIIEELKIENVKTVEEYKNHIQTELKTQKEQQADTHFVTTVINKACENASVEIPESMIQHEIDHKVSEVEQQAKQYNIPLELFMQYNGTTLEDYKVQLRTYAQKKILEELVIKAIAEKEGVVVSEDEFEAEYIKLSELYKQEVKAIKKAISTDLLKNHLLVLKTIDLLKAKAIVE